MASFRGLFFFFFHVVLLPHFFLLFQPFNRLMENFCRNEPDLEFEGLLKRNSTCVEFFQGTMFNSVDLERVKVLNNFPIYIIYIIIFIFTFNFLHFSCPFYWPYAIFFSFFLE